MGLGNLVPDEPIGAPYGADPDQYDVFKEVMGSDFSYRDAPERRSDFLIGTALYIDMPDEEDAKTGVYFAASMIAESNSRGVKTQSAILNNYIASSVVEVEEESDRCKIDVVADIFDAVADGVDQRIEGSQKTRADVVRETLNGVRSGKSYFARWGDARQETKDSSRNHGQDKYDL